MDISKSNHASLPPAVAVLVTGLGAALTVQPAFAHGFGQRYDLPVPLWLWMSGAALAVALSFVVMGLFIQGTPGLHGYPRANVLRWRLGPLLAHPAVTASVEAVEVILLALVVVTGIAGSQNPSRNPAPTLVWVLWWVGFAYISALIGNLWALVNPWSTLFAWVEALFDEPDREFGLRLRYPKRLGAWPAVALFLAFAWVELVFAGRALPANLALFTVVYSLVTWTGMALFGRSVWLAHGDPFALAFGVLARFSPTEVRVHRPDIGVVGARFAWYTAVIAIVLGHIVAVFVAHVTALREFENRAFALRSQYPMLALMVGYTMVSLWIVAQPIVETGAPS